MCPCLFPLACPDPTSAPEDTETTAAPAEEQPTPEAAATEAPSKETEEAAEVCSRRSWPDKQHPSTHSRVSCPATLTKGLLA